MENLPAEVLEIVFYPLSKKKDIENCFNTNSKWRHIIENMFANKSILDSFITSINHEYINMFFSYIKFGWGREDKLPIKSFRLPHLSKFFRKFWVIWGKKMQC